ncbi:MAG: hypothetical protein JWO37_3639 [Acidimicrobiales bacterium]|nr:hypothetical protein [Acidimicrobiales bacterium]
MRVIVTGSQGFIGSALVARLVADGHAVTRLVRTPSPGSGEAAWDIERGIIDAAALEGHDAAVHLAGAGIADSRWTDEQKRAIRDSRTRGTDLLARTLGGLSAPPAVLASGSAIGIYGDRGRETLTEASPPGVGFLADVVVDWEAATAPAVAAGLRVVLLRSGIVLAGTGGALGKQLLPFKLGLGGRLGSGSQYQSWISLDDEVGAILHALSDATLAGPVNLTGPEPVTNIAFTKALGAALHRPTFVPVPMAGLRLVYGRQLVEEMLLASQRVIPAALERSGFRFVHRTVDEALAAAVG